MEDIIFNVGDTVVIKSWSQMEKEFGLDIWGGIKCRLGFGKSMKHLCKKKANIKRISDYGKTVALSWIDDVSDYERFIFSTDMLELINEPSITANETIIITHDGKTTLANYYKNNELITAKAMCIPTDKFDFGFGSIMAVERLFPESKKAIDTFKNGSVKQLEEAVTALPKQFIMKDNTIFCELGSKASFTDTFNQALYVGDIVEFYNDNTKISKELPIVMRDSMVYVAGCRSFVFNKGFDGGHTYIKRVRPYQSIENGAIVGGYIYVKRD